MLRHTRNFAGDDEREGSRLTKAEIRDCGCCCCNVECSLVSEFVGDAAEVKAAHGLDDGKNGADGCKLRHSTAVLFDKERKHVALYPKTHTINCEISITQPDGDFASAVLVFPVIHLIFCGILSGRHGLLFLETSAG